MLLKRGRLRSKMSNSVDEKYKNVSVFVAEMCRFVRNSPGTSDALLDEPGSLGTRHENGLYRHERIHSHPIRSPRSLSNDVRTFCWKFSVRTSHWRVHTELRPVQENVRTVLPWAEMRRLLRQVQGKADPGLRGRRIHSALPPSTGQRLLEQSSSAKSS